MALHKDMGKGLLSYTWCAVCKCTHVPHEAVDRARRRSYFLTSFFGHRQQNRKLLIISTLIVVAQALTVLMGLDSART